MKTNPVRIRDDDWDWLMHNRGAGSLPDKVHELVCAVRSDMAKQANTEQKDTVTDSGEVQESNV